ncbi:MAG TPA: hypothetical protein VH083_09240 [Myxococcales bacterium]|nr:hypothetical protein [Myxococcales bacterium]
MRVALLLLMAAAAASADEHQRNLDVAGIRTGMTVDEATAALRKINPAMEIKVVDGSFQGRNAPFLITGKRGSGEDQEQLEIVLSLPPGAPVVLAVDRYVAYPKAKRPLQAQVMDALKSKFGDAFTMKQPAADRLTQVRVFDEAGKLVREQCTLREPASLEQIENVPSGQQPGCASYIWVEIIGAGGGLAQALHTQASDETLRARRAAASRR